MRLASLIVLVAIAVSACTSSRISDPRAQALLALPGPQHFAERRVARELADRCNSYVFDADLASDMNAARADSADAAVKLRGAIALETNIKRRSLGARYGGLYATLDPCVILGSELQANTPLSVMVLKK